MSWQDEAIPMLRLFIDDLQTTPTYNDGRLEDLLIVAARYVNQDLGKESTYTVRLSTCTISPDPETNNDFAFVNLCVLKAACLLAQAERKIKSRDGIMIKDGPSVIDTRVGVTEVASFASDICEAYKDAVLDYRLGNAKPGKAVLTPFRTYLSGNAPHTRNRPTL